MSKKEKEEVKKKEVKMQPSMSFDEKNDLDMEEVSLGVRSVAAEGQWQHSGLSQRWPLTFFFNM